MNIENLIKERRTVHEYTNEPVNSEIIKKAIELGCYAPNHKLTFPWVFYHLQKEARKKLALRQIELSQLKNPNLAQEVKDNLYDRFAHQGEILILAIKSHPDSVVSHENYASLAMAIQNMGLYLWSLGFGTKWSTGAVTKDALCYEIIQKNPTDISIEGFLLLGRPKVVPALKSRPSIDTLFFQV